MEQWNYKCAHCGITMHQKARGGARQFESVSFAVQSIQGCVLGKVVDDPGRPAASPDNLIGRGTQDGAHDHNFDMFNFSFGGTRLEGHRAVSLRTEPCKDFMLRISMPEDERGTKAQALEALDWFLGVFEKLESDEERAALKCYLTGGHEWEHTHTSGG